MSVTRSAYGATGLTAALACAACSTGSEPDAQTPKTIERLEGGLAGYEITHVKEQGYWYSRYNLGSLVMKSGLGETFAPDMNMMPQIMMMVSDAASTAMGPSNPALLKRVYDAGDPSFINDDDGNPMNLANGRWAETSQKTTSAASFGWTMIKETQWSRQFHVDEHFGAPGGTGATSKPGAQQRFSGMVLYVEAVMQAMEWMNNAGAFNRGDTGDDYVALAALSDLVDITRVERLPHSSSNRYRMAGGMMATKMGMADADALANAFAGAADALYASLSAPTTTRDRALAILGLAFYGNAQASKRAEAKQKVKAYADAIAAALPAGSLDLAHALRGLITADVFLGTSDHNEAVSKAWTALVEHYDGKLGRFLDHAVTSCDDVAVYLGGLNAAFAFGPDAILEDAEIVFQDYFEAAVNKSDMQLSAPPMAALPAYEHFPDELFHRYPTLAKPPQRAGTMSKGTVPVFSSSLVWDEGTKSYQATENRFDTAGAMHLANEMIWFHVDEVGGFPVSR